ncbi:MAG: hypothetical protein IPL65_00390 [Lewinellaceae bacterium]|nr:hypothetical protein [Lewinellaceae bacterium]
MRLLLPLLLTAQLCSAQYFNGNYSGIAEGEPVRLEVNTIADALEGRLIDSQNSACPLKGTVRGNTATGTLTEPQSGASFDFSADQNGDKITFNLLAFGVIVSTIIFESVQTKPPGQAGASVTFMPSKGDGIDGYIVGTWVRSEIINSGSGASFASFTTETKFVVLANGKFDFGASRSVGGGSEWSYGNAEWSAPVLSGTLKTKDQQIFVLTANGQEIPKAQQLMGRYYVEGENCCSRLQKGKVNFGF